MAMPISNIEFKFPHRLDIAQCFNKKPLPLDFVATGFVVGTVGLLTSPGGAGKSMLALQIALSIATGRDDLHLGVGETGSVLFLAGEDPANVLHQRLHDLSNHYSPEERLRISARCDIRATLGVDTNIMSDRWFTWIKDLSKGRRLVVIDTLSRFHRLNENDARDAKAIMSKLEMISVELNISILVLHHVSKASAMNGEGDAQQAARGSSVFVDNARWASFLVGMTQKEAKDKKVDESNRRKYVRWNISKQNYGAPVADKWFERSNGGVLIPASFQSVSEKSEAYARQSQTLKALVAPNDDFY